MAAVFHYPNVCPWLEPTMTTIPANHRDFGTAHGGDSLQSSRVLFKIGREKEVLLKIRQSTESKLGLPHPARLNEPGRHSDVQQHSCTLD